MKTIQKIAQRIIKNRQASVITIFSEKIICYEWLLFGKYIIGKTHKTI